MLYHHLAPATQGEGLDLDFVPGELVQSDISDVNTNIRSESKYSPLHLLHSGSTPSPALSTRTHRQGGNIFWGRNMHIADPLTITLITLTYIVFFYNLKVTNHS